METPTPSRYIWGRDMLEDEYKCSLHTVAGQRCTTVNPPTIECPTYLKIQSLGVAAEAHLPHHLALASRDYASRKALDLLLANPSDINRAMIPALYYQLRQEEDALDFIAEEFQFPNKTKAETYSLLTTQRPSVEQAMSMAGAGPAGLTYAAIVTLIKMNRFRDLETIRQSYPHMLFPEMPVSNMDSVGKPVTAEEVVEAKKDFDTFLTAVLMWQPEFWPELLQDILSFHHAREDYIAGDPTAIEHWEQDAVSPRAPLISPCSWAFPAWWAASAPAPVSSAEFLLHVLVEEYGFHFQHAQS
ncbi:hypothetical protein VP1G_04474 [Cytospora mali]|uniref:Uncharacterized protein n=1 Tax=Cytospora mali TaxID=578113 RepID=A0A194UZN0_CYTMA|nr:hypothetical protein VP1G_04474 [Valsa mali var. pyri (nom. inval.)]